MPRIKSVNRLNDPARGPAPWLRSKAAQLAEFLRRAIQENRLVEPLPGSRDWSRHLGVSRRVLTAAIQELEQEGWLTVHRRGVRLHPEKVNSRARSANAPRVVRLLMWVAYRRHIHAYFETVSVLQEKLRLRGIELQWESCTPTRLRAIARQPAAAHELVVLASVPPVYQRLFAARGGPVVVLGEVTPGIALPFVTADQAGAVRHATFRLLQHGFSEVLLVHIKVEAVGVRSAVAAFNAAVASWPRQPVVGRTVATALDQQSLMTMVRHLATGLRGRTGILVLAPVPVGLVVTALAHHGVAMPQSAEVIALFHSLEAVKLYPSPTHYPAPVSKMMQQLTAAAVQFFDTGHLAPMARMIGSEMRERGWRDAVTS